MPNLLKIFALCTLGTAAFFAACAGLGHYFAEEADQNLAAVLSTVRLVDRFVKVNGRWPESWAELDAPALQERVKIDFKVKLAKMVDSEESRKKFKAILPLGACHSYRESDEVQALLRTIQEKLKVRP